MRGVLKEFAAQFFHSFTGLLGVRRNNTKVNQWETKSMDGQEKQTKTPPEVARKWGVNDAKVLALIDSGELIAINLALNPKGKPRYRILLTEIERFEQSRSTKPPEPKPRRRRRQAGGKDYFPAS